MKITRISSLSLLTTVLVAGTSSCNHKDLCFDHDHDIETEVLFDWRNAPDANPTSMATVMFDKDHIKDPIRYIFSGKDGGTISLPYGKYDAIGINADLNDWAEFRNESDIEQVEIYTRDAERLSAYQLMTAYIPKSRGAEDERMAECPGMAWSARTDNVTLDANDIHKVITIYPEEIVCHYTVTILDIENISFARGEEIDGTLSGLSEAYRHGQKSATDNVVTNPFTLAVSKDQKSITGRFLTFGECPNNKRKHLLTIYLFLSDDSKWYYTFDVTDQVAGAPDPKHVDIVVHGLKLPKPIQSDGGLNPDVNDWQTESIDIAM